MNTSLHRLLQTNIAPNQEEEREIRYALEKEKEENATLELKIARIRGTLPSVEMSDAFKGLIFEQSERRALMRAHKRVLSAVRRIPPEIVAQIFLQCSPEPYISPVPNTVPLLLTHICSGWRSVAAHLPRLWTEVDIEFVQEPPRPDSVALARLWITRSSPLPLTIAIRAYSGLATLTSLLADCANRIRILDLLSTPEFMSALFHPMAHSFIALESITLQKVYNRPAQVDGGGNISISAPKLRGLHLVNFRASDIQIFTARSSWSNLTIIDLELWCTESIFYDILRRCPNLVECQVDIRHRSPVIVVPNILLLYLHRMRIRFVEPVSTVSRRFLRPLVLPNLKIFETNGVCLTAFEALSSRSSFQLDHLILSSDLRCSAQNLVGFSLSYLS